MLHLPRRLRENESGKGPCACGLPLSLHLFTMPSPPSHVPLDKMDRPHVVCMWLQELIVRRIREGGLAVEPPILARAFQARAPLSGRAPRTLPGGTAIAHIASLNHRPRTAAPDPLAAAVGVQEWLRAMPQGKHRGTSRYCPQCHLPVSSAFIAHKTSPLPAPPILHASDRGHAVPVPLGEPLHNLACFAAPPAIARGRRFLILLKTNTQLALSRSSQAQFNVVVLIFFHISFPLLAVAFIRNHVLVRGCTRWPRSRSGADPGAFYAAMLPMQSPRPAHFPTLAGRGFDDHDNHDVLRHIRGELCGLHCLSWCSPH